MTTSSLTDRYVHEVVRRLPAEHRGDIALELRATIADTAEGRNPADPRAAEREVLSELGDPVRYAARYTERPLALIGADLYPAYMRLMKTLLCTVLPAVTVGFVALDIADGRGFGDAVGSGIGTLLTVGAQIVAVLTVVFAVTERVRHRADTVDADSWTPDDLPEAPEPDKGGPVAVAGAVWDALLFGLIVWQHSAQPYRVDGEGIEVLDPELWSGWIWPVLIGLAGLVAVGLARAAARGWTMRLVGWYAAAQALFTLSLAWILQQQLLLNPEFLADAETLFDSGDAVYSGAALLVILIGASGVAKAFRAVRSR
ncbi:hypothetical protein BN159_6061 [Streptomyces davaonensis JCM 4913]|uniref:Uncharacterized protein n=1 Tax=Streptomyces davaonensis (strain DSM 101723 / JCM 4913 / KCC S-0913 / 768) TaxID=1214101 RepID=K4RB66_STRDJ|nr:hypothetical protein [Streptomyces davaonensis]CCK30440.1 hypothetical protein BN159_6061 [Streptomyces davaonensis JCM 4913]